MALEFMFLGTGSAFTRNADNYQSNMIFRKNGEHLLFDAGSDVRHSLNEQGLSATDIGSVYISHLHNDHIGGLEWLALTTKFDPNYKRKPDLYISQMIASELWEHSLQGGLRTIQCELSTLDTFFNVVALPKDQAFIWQGISFHLVQTVHVISGYELMPCYGLLFEYGGKRIFITADTQFCSTQFADIYHQADIIFHDCETSPVASGVHARYSELRDFPEGTKKKMWLYHYNDGPLPDAVKDGFAGFAKKGQVFKFGK